MLEPCPGLYHCVTIGATSTHDGTANNRVPGLLGPFDASHGWHGTFLEKNISSGNIYEEGLGNMNARRSTDRGADHLKLRQLARLTELRARCREGALSRPRRPPTSIQSGPAHELLHFSIKLVCRCKIANQGSKSWSDVDVYDESGSDSCLRDLFLGLRRWRSAR